MNIAAYYEYRWRCGTRIIVDGLNGFLFSTRHENCSLLEHSLCRSDDENGERRTRVFGGQKVILKVRVTKLLGNYP